MPAEWKVHDHNWLVRQEPLADGKWLLCFIANPKRAPCAMSDGWVNVLTREWSAGDPHHNDAVEEHCLQTIGPLEMECLIREMRIKYGGSDEVLPEST